ncbi:hypothetical protein NQ315_012838, partial [Exocentrus adspersus]
YAFNQGTFIKKLSNNFDHLIPERYLPLWQHPAGPKTIFFWAPLFKWGLVIAGLADLRRDPTTISLFQTLSLAITGLIWSRYSIVVIPRNYLLLSVNLFVMLIQCYQLIRMYTYRRSLEPKH